jgi:DNA polymerase III delta prime subunit
MITAKIHRAITTELNRFIKENYFPHILFYGVPGTGKTTMGKLYATTLLKKLSRFNFLELNASDNRGIDTIRNTVIEFCKYKPLVGGRKVIILDEVDYLTPDAQAALRQPMEEYKGYVTFILICNNIAKLHKAILSRCKSFLFAPLNGDEMRQIVKDIIKEQNILISDEKINELIIHSKGDIRYIKNNLFAINIEKGITIEQILNLDPISVSKLIKLNKLIPKTLLQDLLDYHYLSSNYTNEVKVRILFHLAETDYYLSRDTNESLQILALLERIKKVLS